MTLNHRNRLMFSIPAPPIFQDSFETYDQEIIQSMKAKEDRYYSFRCLKCQLFITVFHREALILFMIHLSQRLNIKHETIFMAVNYLDRFLNTVTVAEDCFRLVGLTCLMLACKIEECHPPSMEQFLATSTCYPSKELVKRLEVYILNYIDFQLLPPIAPHFLEHLVRYYRRYYHQFNDQTYIEIRSIAHQLLLTMLPIYRFSFIKPSILAASAFEYAKIICGFTPSVYYYPCQDRTICATIADTIDNIRNFFEN